MRAGVFDLEVLAVADFFDLEGSTSFIAGFVFCTLAWAWRPALVLLLFDATTTSSSILGLVGDFEVEDSLDRFLLEEKNS